MTSTNPRNPKQEPLDDVRPGRGEQGPELVVPLTEDNREALARLATDTTRQRGAQA